ncbi:RNA polymerase I associated factor, A49-like protein [Ilyonectria destructans]|nr:RNA polymerase I associated factor, A49-like protein [Ilyonectria destructans]
MAQVSAKKRKRDGESAVKPKKKVAIDAPPATAAVSSVLRPKFCPPVIATAPGFQIPTNIPFQSYAPKNDAKSKSKQAKSAGEKDFLLHSTAHRSLDYTVKTEAPRGAKPALNHFIGIYDPKTGKLQVVEAKKMVIRGTVRAKQASEAATGEGNAKQSMLALRTDLGQTFGTKKARKAIQENVMNAIAPQRKAGDLPTKIDAASRAMLDTVGEITSTMASREELQAVVDEAKPVPIPNVDATEIQDVYDPKRIIGADILNLVPIREWQEKVRHKEGISIPSRFVAARVNAIASNDDEDGVTRLRVLRYFAFVLLFYLHSKPGKVRGTRSLPSREKLREVLAPAPEAVIENIRRKFSDAGQMRKFHIDLLITHCCTFACIIDNFEVDTQNLRDDLKLDQKTINQYFHEIGGRVKPVVNRELKTTVQLARLTLPLNFPKQRHIAPKRR